MNINLAPIQSQIECLQAAGADKADPNAWTELIAAYDAIRAEIKAALDPAGPGAERWTVIEILGVLDDAIALSQKMAALVAAFLPTKAA